MTSVPPIPNVRTMKGPAFHGEHNAMIQFEYFPVLIEAKRNDIRAIVHPLPAGVDVPPWRHTLGARLVRLGRWIEGSRPTIVDEPPVTLGTTGAA